MSKVIWQFLHQCSPSRRLGDLRSQFKSLEGEQSVDLAYYAGAQNAHVGCAKSADLLGDIAYR